MKKPNLKPDQVLRVYTGRPGCACGCRGKYSIKGAVVNKVLKEFAQQPECLITKIEGLDGEQILYWYNPEGTRTRAIYFRE